MADRTPLAAQLETIERLLERAKAEQDWPTIAPLKATAELVRWTMGQRRHVEGCGGGARASCGAGGAAGST
jgi:hypothetical protein